nr:hypothetical protein LTR18_009728 [Exophiala xenobiotica]
MSQHTSLHWGPSPLYQIPKSFVHAQEDVTSSQTSEVTDLDLNRDLSETKFTGSSSTEEGAHHAEKLFLLCHGCIGTLLVRFGKGCDLATAGPLVKPGHSTLVLTTCRTCTRQRVARRGSELASAPHLVELFQTICLSPAMIEQMHAFQVMQIVSGEKVLILTHNGAVAYEEWEVVLNSLPPGCVCSGIVTDMSRLDNFRYSRALWSFGRRAAKLRMPITHFDPIVGLWHMQRRH